MRQRLVGLAMSPLNVVPSTVVSVHWRLLVLYLNKTQRCRVWLCTDVCEQLCNDQSSRDSYNWMNTPWFRRQCSSVEFESAGSCLRNFVLKTSCSCLLAKTFLYTMSPVDVVCETSVIISKHRVFRSLKPKSFINGPHRGLGLTSLAQELTFSILTVMPARRESIQPLVAGWYGVWNQCYYHQASSF